MKKPLKVIFINTECRSLFEVTVSNLKDMQGLVGGRIELAHELPNGDEIFVNDGGLASAESQFFVVRGGHQPFAGNGFVIGGIDKDGNNTDVKSSLIDMASAIRFLNMVRG